MSELKINTKNYWAHHVYKVEKNKKPYIACILRRKYGEGFEDVDDNGTAQFQLGIDAIPKKRMIWDNNPDSETFQQRIQDPNDEGGSPVHTFTIPMTKKIIEEIDSMCGISNFSHTQYFWLFHGKPPIQAQSLKELVSGSNTEIIEKIIYQKQEVNEKND